MVKVLRAIIAVVTLPYGILRVGSIVDSAIKKASTNWRL